MKRPILRAAVYHGDRQGLSTARFGRAGQLATAPDCCRYIAVCEAARDRGVSVPCDVSGLT